jgi:outer membrane protein assembly factor BamB
MNRRQLILVAGATLLAIVTMALKCGDQPPTVPEITAPSGTVYQNAELAFKFKSTQPQEKNVKYVVNWGDGRTDTSTLDYPSGTEATLRHTWVNAGDFEVKALAFVADKPDLASDWSGPKSVTIGANAAPTGVAITYIPLNTAKNRDTRFEAIATDPEGDSVAYQFDYNSTGGGDLGSWTALVPSGTPGEDIHKFSRLGEYWVKVRARDHKGSVSAWTDSSRIMVDTTGVVLWAWVSPDEDEGPAIGSPLVMMRDADELVYVGAEDEFGRFYGIKTIDGRRKVSGSGATPEEYFTGHPAYVASTGNIIVGCEDGELYAFNKSLTSQWRYPRAAEPTNIEWGVPAINGTKVYCTRDDDKIYYLTDNGSSATYQAAYTVRGIKGNPVIDNAGNVIVVTDTGRILILDGNLTTVVWDTLLNGDGKALMSPVIGGTDIYVGDEVGNVYALRADRSLKWKTSVIGEAGAIVLGTGAVYVATGSGRLYRLNPETGAPVWNVTLTGENEVAVSPILTANGFIYVHDDQDALHCLKQDDGSYVWICYCDEAGPTRSPGRRAGRDFENPAYSPALTSRGDIVIVGIDALYLVAGYTEGTLAPAPWPKWQGGVYNTGKAGSF